MISKQPPHLPDAGTVSLRELQAVREVAQSFLTARHPEEVYRIALERVAPLVGAAFGCVFLREGTSDLLRIVAKNLDAAREALVNAAIAEGWPCALEDIRTAIRQPSVSRTGEGVQAMADWLCAYLT